MADNVSITAGSGTTVHADEYTHSTLGSGKTQLVKLVDGTLDSSTAIAAGGGVEAGALRVTIASDSTGVVSIDDNGGAITVDGTVTVQATDLDIRPLLNTDVVTAELSATDNAVLDTIAAKDFATQTTLAAINTKLASGTVIGDVNLGATDNAVLDDIAAKLATIDADTSTLAAGVSTEYQVDVVGALPAGTNALGKMLPPDIDVTTHTNYAKKYYTNAGAVTDGIIWSPAAGKRWHILSLTINVSAAATVTLEDDKAGGDEAVMKFEFAANSGITIPFPEKYPFASGEDAADLIITTTAGNVYVTAVGYEI